MPQVILLDSFEGWDVTDPHIKWDVIANYSELTLGAQYGRNGSGARVRSGGTSVFDPLGESVAIGNSSVMLEKYFQATSSVDVGLALKLDDREPIDYIPIISFLDTTVVLSALGNYYSSQVTLLLTPQQQLVFCEGGLFASPFAILGTYSPPIKRGVFSYLEARVNIGTEGLIQLRMDGKVVISQQVDTAFNATHSFTNGVRLFNHKSRIGQAANARTYTIDDVYIAIDGPVQFRDGFIESDVPIENGGLRQWTPSNGGTFNYDMVDEAESDEDNTYNQTSEAAITDTYTFPPLSVSGSIHGVALNIAVANKAFDEATLSAVFRRDETNYPTSPLRVGTIMGNNPLGYKYNIYGFANSPATGYQFSENELLSGEFGMQTVAVGNGEVAPPPPQPTIPNAPSNPSLTVVSSSQLNFTYSDNSNNETEFKIELSLTSGSGFSQIITRPANVTSYQFTGLAAETTYYARVRATNIAGDSEYSSEASATTSAAPAAPAAPSNLAATPVSSTQNNLTWDDNSLVESGVKVERSLSSGSGYSQIFQTGVNAVSYPSTGLTASTQYFYRVRAFNNGGDSAYSNVASATTLAAPPPPPDPDPPPPGVADYYTSTLGSDGNIGTIDRPFRTIEKGISVLTAGKKLHIRSGTYIDDIKSNTQVISSGTSWTNAITIAAYPGESVTLRPSTGHAVVQIFGHRKYIIFDRLILDGVNTQYGVALSGSHIANTGFVRFTNCEIKNATHSGVLTGGESNSNEFIGCNVHDNGEDGFDHGLYLASSSNLVEKCLVHHNSGYGIHGFDSHDPRNCNNNVFRKNRCYSNSTNAGAAAGILIGSGDNNKAYNNICYDQPVGIMAGFSNATNSKIYNNTCHDNSADGIHIRESNSTAFVRNNISFGNGNGSAEQQIDDRSDGTTLSNNTTTNPSFVNSANRDYHLQSGSSAINAGVTLSEVPDDHDGNLRPQGSAYDTGAYERVS